MQKWTVSPIVAILALTFTVAGGAAAQQEQRGQEKPLSGSIDKSVMMTDPANKVGMMDGKMMEGCQEMKAQKQSMREETKSQNAQLAEQLAKMNSASESDKTKMIAAVLTQMVEQRITMDARKAKLEEAMMKHTMQHMQTGKESMSQCPMMKDMNEKSSSAQSQQ